MVRSGYAIMKIELSKETEQYLKDYLREQGLAADGNSDAISTAMNSVVQEAIEGYLFRHMVQNAHKRNKDLDVAETEKLIEEVIREDRKKQRLLNS